MASEAYQRFVESFFAQTQQAAMEGPDVNALLSLEGEERVHAEQMLLDRLGPGDSRPAIGLGALGSLRAAPRLRSLLTASRPLAGAISGGFLANVAAASFRIEKNPEAIEALVDLLQSSPLVTVRAMAAKELGECKAPEAMAALSAALMHESILLRGTAAAALIHLHGLDQGLSGPHPAVVEVSRGRDPGQRQKAAEALLALVAGAKPA